MWEYIGLEDTSSMAEGQLLAESVDELAWKVLGSTSGETGAGAGLAPFSVFEPRPDDFPYKGAVSLPPSPMGEEGQNVGDGSSLPLEEMSLARAIGIHPCSGSLGEGAPSRKRRFALRLNR